MSDIKHLAAKTIEELIAENKMLREENERLKKLGQPFFDEKREKLCLKPNMTTDECHAKNGKECMSIACVHGGIE